MIKEGHFRVAAGLFIGFLAKLVGKSGVFYQIAGRQTALIDDVTGTMPPFDKSIVYGPENTKEVVNNLKSRLNCFGAVIADVNDLKRSRIVDVTDGVMVKWLLNYLSIIHLVTHLKKHQLL